MLKLLRPNSSYLLEMHARHWICKAYVQKYKHQVKDEATKILVIFKRHFRNEVKKWLQENPAQQLQQAVIPNVRVFDDFNCVASTVR